jgi:hypothetical protein
MRLTPLTGETEERFEMSAFLLVGRWQPSHPEYSGLPIFASQIMYEVPLSADGVEAIAKLQRGARSADPNLTSPKIHFGSNIRSTPRVMCKMGLPSRARNRQSAKPTNCPTS